MLPSEEIADMITDIAIKAGDVGIKIWIDIAPDKYLALLAEREVDSRFQMRPGYHAPQELVFLYRRWVIPIRPVEGQGGMTVHQMREY